MELDGGPTLFLGVPGREEGVAPSSSRNAALVASGRLVVVDPDAPVPPAPVRRDPVVRRRDTGALEAAEGGGVYTPVPVGSTPVPVGSTELPLADRSRWMLDSRGIFPPASAATAVTANYVCQTGEVESITADWGATEGLIFWAGWGRTNGGQSSPEFDATQPFTIAATISINDGPLTPVTWADLATGELDGSNGDKTVQPGGLVLAKYTIPQGGAAIFVRHKIVVRTFRKMAEGDAHIGGYRVMQSGRPVLGLPSKGSQYTTAANEATARNLLTGGTFSSSPAGGQFVYYYGPALMLTNGWDGRAVLGIFGDSLGFGAGEGGDAISWVTNGLDDTRTGKHTPYANFSLSGSRPSDMASIAPGKFRRVDELIMAAAALNGGQMPYTHTFHEGGVNNGSTDPTVWTGYIVNECAFLKTRYGNPVTQASLAPRASSTDQWASYAGQTPQADARNEVNRRLAALTGTAFDQFIDVRDGFVDPSHPSKWGTMPFTTRLVNSYDGSGDTLDFADEPPVGAGLVISPGRTDPANPATRLDIVVTLDSATTVTQVKDATTGFITHYALASTSSRTQPAGAVVREVPTTDGPHPTRRRALPAAAIVARLKPDYFPDVARVA